LSKFPKNLAKLVELALEKHICQKEKEKKKKKITNVFSFSNILETLKV
jgi:hypothetical protein